ncbi:MAG: RNA polymerase sigma factor [Candidatus Rokubacteria bacterium]|nr:RNA polymerase sigma factor [Candidatus Rokubacteria bacterium]
MAEQAFDGVIARHHAEIFRFLRRLCRGAGEADDLSQETFLRAFRAWEALPADANVRAWLYRIAANLARNHFRSERRRRVAHATVRVTEREAASGEPEGEALANEARRLVEARLAALPDRQRLAFVMRRIQELEYEVIAESLECSVETARAHVFQAMKKIRQGLSGHLPVAGARAR